MDQLKDLHNDELDRRRVPDLHPATGEIELGQANISTTSGYLHARPGGSGGLKLDRGVFLQQG